MARFKSKKEIERFEKQRSNVLGDSSLVGQWVVRYDNTAVRHYNILANGTVIALAKGTGKRLTGKVMRNNDDLLLNFGDGKLKPLSIKTTLLIEHYLNAASYPNGKPNVLGIAERSKTSD